MDFKDDYVITEVTTCGNCGEKDNFRDVTTDMIDHIETEKDRICNNCDELMDSWAYGQWQKEIEDAAAEAEKQAKGVDFESLSFDEFKDTNILPF